jgi:hypothetical protein
MDDLKCSRNTSGLIFLNNFGADLEDRLESSTKQYNQYIGFFNGLGTSIDVIKAMTTETSKEEFQRLNKRLEMLRDKAFQDMIETKGRGAELDSIIKFLTDQIGKYKALLDNPNVGVRPESKPEKAKARRKEKTGE